MAVTLVGASATATAQPVTQLPLSVGGADTRIEWAQVVVSPNDDWINDLSMLRNGNVLGVGFVNRADGTFDSDWQAVQVEIDPAGRRVAEHRYGAGGGTDAFWSAEELDGGNRIFAGLTSRLGPGGINGYVLVSRPDGTIVKENGYGHPGYDRFTDLAPGEGGFVFVGHSQSSDERMSRRTYILKTDPNGLPLWERIYGGPEMWSALYIEPSGDGGFIIAGGMATAGDGDMFAMKVDSEGRELWRKRVGTPDWDEINHGIVIRPDGTIVLVGYTNQHGSDQHDWVAATLAPDGDIIRLERYGGPKDERARLAKLDGDGTIWMIGHTDSAGTGDADLLLSTIDANGAFTGVAMTLGGAQEDIGTAVLPLGKDSILLAGYGRNLGPGGQDAFIARLSRPTGKPHPAFRRTVVIEPRPAR
ncbi:MAG TPA: hypothetical protein VFZ35_02860 [Sphingomicrobium sp.]